MAPKTRQLSMNGEAEFEFLTAVVMKSPLLGHCAMYPVGTPFQTPCIKDNFY
jgi:hypothetical protein